MNTYEEELRAEKEENRRLREALDSRDQFIHETFGRYLTDEILEEILSGKTQVQTGGERRVVTIMFADLRQSTLLSERMDPVDFIRMLNAFLAMMIEIINAWQGNILDFVGDAIVAVFGAPRVNDDSARDAAACAVAMQRNMPRLNEWNRKQGFPEIAMGIGLHTGEAILGNIGSQTRAKYDAIGRNVNLSSRVQGYTEGGQILATTELIEAAGKQVIENKESAMWVRPKGIQTDILLHDVIGFGSQYIPRAEDADRQGGIQ